MSVVTEKRSRWNAGQQKEVRLGPTAAKAAAGQQETRGERKIDSQNGAGQKQWMRCSDKHEAA